MLDSIDHFAEATIMPTVITHAAVPLMRWFRGWVRKPSLPRLLFAGIILADAARCLMRIVV